MTAGKWFRHWADNILTREALHTWRSCLPRPGPRLLWHASPPCNWSTISTVPLRSSKSAVESSGLSPETEASSSQRPSQKSIKSLHVHCQLSSWPGQLPPQSQFFMWLLLQPSMLWCRAWSFWVTLLTGFQSCPFWFVAVNMTAKERSTWANGDGLSTVPQWLSCHFWLSSFASPSTFQQPRPIWVSLTQSQFSWHRGTDNAINRLR